MSSDTKKCDENSISISTEKKNTNERLVSTLFLLGVAGMFFVGGFTRSISSIKKNSNELFKTSMNVENNHDAGRALAMRALAWGSLYSVAGCGTLFFGIWKLSGAKDFEEFRLKMGNSLPKISSGNRTTIEELEQIFSK